MHILDRNGSFSVDENGRTVQLVCILELVKKISYTKNQDDQKSFDMISEYICFRT